MAMRIGVSTRRVAEEDRAFGVLVKFNFKRKRGEAVCRRVALHAVVRRGRDVTMLPQQ